MVNYVNAGEAHYDNQTEKKKFITATWNLPLFFKGLKDGFRGRPCFIESISISLGVEGRLIAGLSFLSEA